MIIDETKTLPHSWQWIKLGDVCDVTKLAGFEYTEHITYSSYGEYIALRAQNVRNYGLDLQKIVYISKETASFLSRSKLNFGDVVMTFIGANIGEATWIDKNDTYYCAPNIAKITPNKKLLYHRFLTRVIHSPIIRQQIEELNKSTAQPSLSMQNIRDFFLPIPPISEQKCIAEILEKCDRLRRTRRYALQLSDTFLQSVFLQMFGNPITNPMNWDIEDMDSQITSIRYGTSLPPEYQHTGIPFIRATNIKNGYIQSERMVYITNSEAHKIPKCKVKEGDLIIVRSGVNTGDTAVVSKLYDGAYAAYDLIVELDKTKAYYYNFLINSDYGKAIIEPLTRRAGQPHINAEQVCSLRFPSPPFALQEKFAQIVQKFERLRTQQRESDRQAEHLFQTLLHRAFLGELTSSDFNDEAVSVFSQEISVQQPKPKSTVEVAEYLHTKVNQQETEAVQLTLPGLE